MSPRPRWDDEDDQPRNDWIRHRGCTQKKRYPSEGLARRAITTVRRGGRWRTDHTPTRAYPCPYCHGWHLTSGD